jgi:signal transduction histidine kinase
MVIRRKNRPCTKPADFEKVKLPVLRPIVLVILTLLAVFTGCIYWLQERRIDDHVRDQVGRAKLLLRECRVENARLLRGVMDPLLRDRELQRYWLSGDRPALLNYAKPMFDEWKSQCQITHFYFHGLDRVCFLRVHDPNRRDDLIQRVTLDRAAESQDASWGIEVGPLGTFALRLVHPWRIEGKVVGYIEVGEEIDHIIAMVKQILGVELVVVADKSFLNRRGWEDGMKMLGREANWDLLPHFVVSDHTLGRTVGWSTACGALCSGGDENRLFKQTIDGRRYGGGVIILSDAADRPVGKVVVLCDIEAEKASLRQLLFMMVDLSVVVVVAIAVLFGRFIRDIEHRLTVVYADLKTEIQKRKSVEEELRKHQDHLEDLVRHRTVELETTNRHLSQEIADRMAAEDSLHDLNEELQQTVGRLDVANRDLKSFVHVAAHDLKAPIRAVGTLADWIREDCEGKISESSKGHLDMLENRAARLSRHIDRILEYSEISSGNGLARPVDLNVLVREVIGRVAVPPGIDVVVENELPIIMADRTRMTQIFENLLGNAVKYMSKPTGSVRVGCATDGDGWRFHISDTGPGIEERFFSKVFQMFQTLSPRDEVEATGMGLSIVKRIVELHGGTIWVESVVSRGSTFFFTLYPQTPQAVAATPEVALAGPP